MSIFGSLTKVTAGEVAAFAESSLESGEDAIRAIFDWRLSLLRSLSFGAAGLAFTFLVAGLGPLVAGKHHVFAHGWEVDLYVLTLVIFVLTSAWSFIRCIRLAKDLATSLCFYSDLVRLQL